MQEEECEIDILQQCVEDSGSQIAEGECSMPISLSGGSNKIHDNAGGKPKCS